MSLRFFHPAPAMVPLFARGMGSHMLPLLTVAAHRRCDVASLDQGRKPFSPPSGRAWVVIIGDDPAEPETSFGPHGFHYESVERLLKCAADISLISCEIIPSFYERAAALAVFGLPSVIIETRPKDDAKWTALANRAAPGRLRSTGRVDPKWGAV